MTDVLMPRLSDSMQDGTVLTWLVADGEAVAAGQELAEIETDKATLTFEAESDGVLEVVAPAGSTVAVGEVIARVGAGGEPVAAVATPDSAPEPPTPGPQAPRSAPVGGPARPHANGERDDVPATPMARRIAAVHGVALAELQGTGPRGRVVRADVQRAAGIDHAPADAPRAPVDAAPAPAPPAPTPAADDTEGDRRVTPTRQQALIARRMAESKATIPHFQVETEVEMSAALAFREQLKQLRQLAAGDDTRATPSLNDLIVKACALALRRIPRANGAYTDGQFVLHARVNIGIAVAGEDALVVPIIHDADRRTLGEIAAVARELAAAVRAGTVTPPQLSGGTFTVSNLGMYGMTAITPVINPPQAAILGVGAIRATLGRDAAGEIVDRRLLTLRLSCDHRILYGADAARFLGTIRQTLESPAGLAL